MTKVKIRMANEADVGAALAIGHWSFVIRIFFASRGFPPL
jgi:hypothetical protein